MDFDYLKQKRILLVDDEQELLDMVISILNEDGFQNIKTAKTVAEAIVISETYQPEFAILDVMLPDGNGFDAQNQFHCHAVSQGDYRLYNFCEEWRLHETKALLAKTALQYNRLRQDQSHGIYRHLRHGQLKITRDNQPCEAAWGDNPFGYENSLMAHIRRIREKIEANPSQPVSLITVKGLGYKLIVEGK